MSSDRLLPLIEEETRDLDLDKSEETAVNGTSVRQLDGTDAEWKYRGRTESETIEKQPIGAPAGMTAQKDEGFQRFYKAVVSPTHVRVTAGGRIVPNTRGCSSPTAKWAKERSDNEGSYSHGPTGRSHAESGYVPMAQPIYGPVPQVFPGYSHGFPQAVMQGHQPITMMPLHIGVGMPSMFGIMPPGAVPTSTGKPAARSSMSPGASDVGCAQESPAANTSLRISPPEQFDHSRPFVYNGQFMMPTGGAFCPYPMPAPGPSFTSPSGTAMMQPRFGIPQVVHHPMKHGAPIHSRMVSSSSNTGIPGAPNVPVSSIRPSDITKKQLDVLRSALRYFEDQLQYNKHQIDEKSMESQARMVREQILNFEKTLGEQLESEQASYPGAEFRDRTASTALSDDAKAPAAPAERNTEPGSTVDDPSFNGQNEAVSRDKQDYESRNTPVIKSIKSIKSNSAPVSTKISPESSEESEPIRKLSTLPVNAALAPPFQPRSESTSSAPGPRITRYSSRSSTETEQFEQQQAVNSSESTTADLKEEQPYLVGSLPTGACTETDGQTGYLYCRDLTEDELRARHMYWGKAPRHLQKGLPKFDGKDFYPPSPVKSRQDAARSLQGQGSRILSDNNVPGRSSMAPKARNDPFQSFGRSANRLHRYSVEPLTKSEHLPSTEEASRASAVSKQASPNKESRSYDDFRKALADHSDSSIEGGRDKSSDDGDDGTNILFKGRKFMTQNGLVTQSQLID